MTAQFHIRATDPERQALWSDIFGRETLPVVRPFARPGRDGDPVYDIDLGQCHPLAASRLAAYIARRDGGDYGRILADLRVGGVALPAPGCELLEPAALATAVNPVRAHRAQLPPLPLPLPG